MTDDEDFGKTFGDPLPRKPKYAPRRGESQALFDEPGGDRRDIAKRIRGAKARRDEHFERELEFQIRVHCLPEPERQYRFAELANLTLWPGRAPERWRADFAWPVYRLLLEVQGGIWKRGGGAHSHPIDIEREVDRQQCATLLGWYVLPVTTDQVKKGDALAILQRVLAARGWKRGQ